MTVGLHSKLAGSGLYFEPLSEELHLYGGPINCQQDEIIKWQRGRGIQLLNQTAVGTILAST